jgi:hypothetical protein
VPPPPTLPAATDAITRELARLLHAAMGQALDAAAQAAQAGDAARLGVPAAPEPTAPKRLAATQAAGPRVRRDTLMLYQRCLRHYREAIQPRATPLKRDDDLGAAAAFFVLANLAALHGSAPDDALLPVLTAQLAHLIERTGAWEQAPLAERQALFEQLALLGVLVNESRIHADVQGHAARANLQRAARAYLLQFPGFDADRVHLTPRGLVLAAASA